MARGLLERFEITVLKNKSGSDTAQVPAQATINLYRRGATVSTVACRSLSPRQPGERQRG